MRLYTFIVILFLAALACNEPANTEETSTKEISTPKAPATKASTLNAAAEQAQKAGKASASTSQNLSTGYWHIGGAVNTSEGGKKYEGEWIQFNIDQTYVYGKDDKEVENGVWMFDEDKEYITLKESNGKERFYAHEFQCKQIGDIILLLGNTPNNPRGTQIKLVRQDTKIIEHNPN